MCKTLLTAEDSNVKTSDTSTHFSRLTVNLFWIRKVLAGRFIFFKHSLSYAEFSTLSRDDKEKMAIMGFFREKTVFFKFLTAASPMLIISICVSKKSFWARQDDSNGTLRVRIRSLYAEIIFSGTRLLQRFLPSGCRCGNPHSVHRSPHTRG